MRDSAAGTSQNALEAAGVNEQAPRGVYGRVGSVRWNCRWRPRAAASNKPLAAWSVSRRAQKGNSSTPVSRNSRSVARVTGPTEHRQPAGLAARSGQEHAHHRRRMIVAASAPRPVPGSATGAWSCGGVRWCGRTAQDTRKSHQHRTKEMVSPERRGAPCHVPNRLLNVLFMLFRSPTSERHLVDRSR